VKPLVAIAAVSASLFALPAVAQDGGADPRAPDAYAGVSKDSFYSTEQRLQAAEARARGNPAMMREIRSIRAFIAQQRARHGGELRDWDREAVNTRLARIAPEEQLTATPAAR
jgi:hypothetical protein